MLRVHFDGTDLARVRLRPPPLMIEVMYSAELLRQRLDGVLFDEWRRRTRQRLNGSVRPLLELVPPDKWWPAFLAPPEPADDLGGALDTIRATPRQRMHQSFASIALAQPLPASARRLADGDPEALTLLTAAIRGYHDAAVAPYLQSMRACIEADLAVRARILAEGGIGRLFASLHPSLRWESPTLYVPSPYDEDIHLGGRGL